MQQDERQKTIDCVFHIPTPVGDNSAGITWAAAVVKDKGGADNISSVLHDIDAGELTSMKAGTLIEVPKRVRFSSIFLNNAQRLAQVQAAFIAEQTAIQAEKQITLAFVGYEGDIA
ncbi:MAG: hypothetical protein GWN00_04035 [Aliifodinibius sp.]|nr:hypothetical protein [Fodinibius sp.]NIY24004.1 hypothetical protein [Fodinibius sp.]